MRERSWPRVIGWFALGLLSAAVVAEGSARIAEVAGPPVLRWYDASTQLKVEQMDELGTVDVVFAGTSMAWQGFVPAAFSTSDPDGRSAYNAGLAGGVPAVMEPWMLEEVVPRLQPDLVVWGLSSMDFSTSYGDDNLERYRDALETRTGRLARVEQATSRVSALVRYRTVLRRPSAMFGSEKEDIESDFDEAAAILGEGGERRDFAVDFGPERGAQVEARFRNYRIDETDIQAVARTVESLRSRGVDVVLVEMPVPDRYVELHPEGADDVARAHETIVALGDVLDLRVVDLRRGYSEEDFVDFTHLNAAAAADLTDRLAGALAAGEGPGAPQTPPPVSADPLTDTTRRAFTTIEALFHPLTGGGETLRVPDHWYGRFGYLHEWNAAWHRAIGNEFDAVFVGSSMMLYAGDPRVFVEVDGKGAGRNRTAYNASLPGSYPEDQRLWLEDFVLDRFSPSLVIWGLAPRDVQSFDNGPNGGCLAPTKVWDKMVEAREGSFAPIGGLSQLSWQQLYFGDVLTGDADPLVRTEMSTLGDRLDYGEGPVVEEIPLPQAAQARFGPLGGSAAIRGGDEPENESDFAVCEERLTTITDTVE
jgi:hypothetical protein